MLPSLSSCTKGHSTCMVSMILASLLAGLSCSAVSVMGAMRFRLLAATCQWPHASQSQRMQACTAAYARKGGHMDMNAL